MGEGATKEGTGAAVGSLMDALYGLPPQMMDGLNKDMDEAAKYEHYTNNLKPVRLAFETSFPAVFGSLVQCVEDDGLTPVTNPGNECQQYWGHGAFIYQLQFVLMYLNLIARTAVVSTDPQVWLATLHSKLQVFSPLLQILGSPVVPFTLFSFCLWIPV